MSEETLEYTLEEGKYLVTLARKAILHHLSFGKQLPTPKDAPPKLIEKSGVFVTLNSMDENKHKSLRGCIGFPLPVYPLVEATIQAANSAAFRDFRFPTVQINEMPNIVVEVTILTKPIILEVKTPEEYLKLIKIGRDGLIVKRHGASGLLLPQVPVDWSWNVKEFLEHTCNKAGLHRDCWKDSNTSIERFSGIIFQEEEPNGEIVQEEI